MKVSYAHMKKLFEMNQTLSAYIITADKDIEESIKPREPDRRRKLYNGRLETCFYQYYGERPPRAEQK